MRLPRLTYANVVATLALFLALGGGAYAATRLPANSVGTKQLKGEAVSAGKLTKAVRRLMSRSGATGATGAEGKQGPEGKEGRQGAAGEALLGGEASSLYVQNGFTHSFSGELEGDERISSLGLVAGRYEITGKVGAEAKDEVGGGGELWCGLVINGDEVDASAGNAARGERLALETVAAVYLEEEAEVQLNCISGGPFTIDPEQTHLLALPVSSIR